MTATDMKDDAARQVDFPFRRPGEPFPPPGIIDHASPSRPRNSA